MIGLILSALGVAILAILVNQSGQIAELNNTATTLGNFLRIIVEIVLACTFGFLLVGILAKLRGY